MNPPDQTVRDIIGHLACQLAKSWQAFLVAKYVHEARSVGRINCSHYFFDSVEESCLEVAILVLAKIVVPNDDSINIHYLLNYSEQNPEAYRSSHEKVIRDCVLQHKKQLENIAPLIANIKEQRDHTIAHLDKKHIKNPSAVYTHPPLDYREVENLYRLLLGAINAYSGYLVPSDDIHLDNIAPEVAGDLQYLTKLIERDNAKP